MDYEQEAGGTQELLENKELRKNIEIALEMAGDLHEYIQGSHMMASRRLREAALNRNFENLSQSLQLLANQGIKVAGRLLSRLSTIPESEIPWDRLHAKFDVSFGIPHDKDGETERTTKDSDSRAGEPNITSQAYTGYDAKNSTQPSAPECDFDLAGEAPGRDPNVVIPSIFNFMFRDNNEAKEQHNWIYYDNLSLIDLRYSARPLPDEYFDQRDVDMVEFFKNNHASRGRTEMGMSQLLALIGDRRVLLIQSSRGGCFMKLTGENAATPRQESDLNPPQYFDLWGVEVQIKDWEMKGFYEGDELETNVHQPSLNDRIYFVGVDYKDRTVVKIGEKCVFYADWDEFLSLYRKKPFYE